ncbi:MAG TPA: M14 family metallopeptidase [Flavisolibacter sp.]|nr:M14 family metallopeptidase [Flavisolibacter sp.]
MARRIVALAFFILLVTCSFAQLKSPEEFLGYRIGTKFTPHWKIVDYFKSVATAVPSMVKLEQYGQTNEGRPLMVAYVSSETNVSNLENIRRHNLSLARQENTATSNSDYPAIVWLSYNVHGNEASSSEASMLTLYALVDPKNSQTKQWLKNTLVIIDPCLNPDGRDRYVNWFNSVVGKNPNPSLDAREHDEPWPGGRSNHYNFDLNRDWAWQTQVESQARVAIYNRWLPQVHVDFHEQGINAPYYFAPAAQPYHEVITKWQRDFQNTIGRNNAKYFDEKGWLFFTKEEFDLTYPAYGDTYPLYNGAIGMTYEQAGHSMGGLAAQTAIGDTLTLIDRATHHYTSSLSTIEVASQNASKLISEFKKFYDDAVTNGVGNYKSYVIKYNDIDAEKIENFLDLLTKNGIEFGTSKAVTSLKGVNYDSRKEEPFSTTINDIVVSSFQPKSALVKVLFEPNTFLVDTLAYDITAWSLPYVFGLKAFATAQRIDATSPVLSAIHKNESLKDAYAYVIRWSGMQSVKLAAQLLQKGIKLRYNERSFEVNGQSFDRGAILVLKTSNQYIPDLWNTVVNLANEYNVKVTPVNSGFVDKGFDFGSSKVHPLKARKIAMLTGEGVSSNAAGEVWFYFDKIINYPITLINASDATSVNWSKYDVVILPNGNYRFLNDKNAVEQFKNWISHGGNVIALESAVSKLAQLDWGLKSKKDDASDTSDIYASLRKFEGRDRDFIPSSNPGSIFRVELDNTNPLAFGYPDYYYTLKSDDNVYEFIKDGGWNVGVLKKDKPVAGFVGSKVKNKFQDGLLFGVQEMGNGTITYLADDVLFRCFWENGKLMFSNAVFLVGQ